MLLSVLALYVDSDIKWNYQIYMWEYELGG